MASRSATLWRIAQGSALLCRRLDSELLIFDPLSWQTHLLNQTATALVESLRNQPRSVADLSETLAPGDEAFRHGVQSLIQDLSAIGLIEPAVEEN